MSLPAVLRKQTDQPPVATDQADLAALLRRQRDAARGAGVPAASVRIDRLRRLRTMIAEHAPAFVAAATDDFGSRPAIQTQMELASAASSAHYAERRVSRWMRRERVSLPAPLAITGARAEILPQPLGVIGVMSPWNFPFALSLTPLAGILAAGNRALVKPSELAPASAAAFAEAVRGAFDPDELHVVLGGVEVAQAFSALPFDHLLFTGSPGVARHVMRAAAANLVPVTLELGGKCPVVIDRDADLTVAAKRVLWGKMQNAGQICLAPDTVFVPHELADPFVAACTAVAAGWFPKMRDNPDYCAIINQGHYARLDGYVREATAHGLRVDRLLAEDIAAAPGAHRKYPFTIVHDAPETLAISREEIFGPVMALRRYAALDEVIDYVNARPRPLAAYYFGRTAANRRRIEEEIVAGGMTVDDVVVHAGVEELPLGGVGESGMGSYHGKGGFDRFSHRKPILRQGRLPLGALFVPPYRPWMTRLVERMLRPVAGSARSEVQRGSSNG